MNINQIRNVTKQEYIDEAITVLHSARFCRHAAEEFRVKIAKKHGDNGFPNRYPISGGICDHWPQADKDAVVSLVHRSQDYTDKANRLWKLSGKRQVTFNRCRDEINGC